MWHFIWVVWYAYQWQGSANRSACFCCWSVDSVLNTKLYRSYFLEAKQCCFAACCSSTEGGSITAQTTITSCKMTWKYLLCTKLGMLVFISFYSFTRKNLIYLNKYWYIWILHSQILVCKEQERCPEYCFCLHFCFQCTNNNKITLKLTAV